MTKALCALGLGLALTACEPPDEGGGAGIDGRLAFIRSGALVVSMADGSAERNVTYSNSSSSPALSPNGQTIAFLYSPDGSTPALYRVAFSGEEPEPVLAPGAGETFSSPAWMPNGSTLLVVSRTASGTKLLEVSQDRTSRPLLPSLTDVQTVSVLNSNEVLVTQGVERELALVTLSTGAVETLGITTDSRPSAFMGGRRIAYGADDGTIRVLDLTTREEVSLATSGRGDRNPVFVETDGSVVAFEAANRLYAAFADGTDSAVPLQDGTQVTWAP